MNWNAAVDIYCERSDPSLWSEPVNLLTNLFFVGSALWFHLQTKKYSELQRPAWRTLVALVYAIGFGSAVFHSVATTWAQAADVIPIGIFLLAYIDFYGRVLSGFPLRKQIGLFSLFAVLTASLALMASAEATNGSHIYFGTYGMLFWFTWHSRTKGFIHWRLYLAAAFVFLAALIFRSIDMRVCSEFPLGTHFLWHILNGAVIFLVLFAAMRWLRSKQFPGATR